MQQIIDFIIRKKDVVVYLILLIFSLTLVFNSNYFHKSKVLIFSNSIANYSTENFNYLNEYFELKKINSNLLEENLFLKNQLEKINKNISLDSLTNINFSYKNAKVISNNLSSFKNRLVINKGIKDGLKNEMGVINSDGIIGIVNYTSKNYSSIMSILNIETKINAKIKKTSHFGTLEWDGLSTKYLKLNDIPETANIKIGDSIVTGGMSLIFPEGIKIGVVSKISKHENQVTSYSVRSGNNDAFKYESRENYLNIKVKLNTDMSNLNNVYIIESLNREEFQKVKK
ncbi:rod shape-determining protein MreC [Flavobacteriaceae bacterium]|nr:rod shape-determining protein MreC [Flavobacteriaceae bacterium]MDB4163873.1 rod shape-determining protein MreC [Flavobacteriaceae bacterium]MDB9794196.1 rod shape-determining protein MreC [Flavobacteriaceae bacterium]